MKNFNEYEYDVRLKNEISEFIDGLDGSEALAPCLLRIMDSKGLTSPQVYHRAELDRQVFNKLIQLRHPRRARKITLLQICVGLKATEEEAVRLLKTCGFTFELSQVIDRAFLFCIQRGRHTMMDVWEARQILEISQKQSQKQQKQG